MKRLFIFIIWLAFCSAIAFAAQLIFDVSFLMAFTLVTLALIANGVIAEIEDYLPGGFLNEDGSHTPRWLSIASLAARSVALLFIFICGINIIVMLPDQGSVLITWIFRVLFLVISVLLALMLLHRKRARMFLWMTIVIFTIGAGFAFLFKATLNNPRKFTAERMQRTAPQGKSVPKPNCYSDIKKNAGVNFFETRDK